MRIELHDPMIDPLGLHQGFSLISNVVDLATDVATA